ncbi:MAG: hypothetical protein J0H49_10660 [Acidobacteria bacterium]|nr:hypothetical protein [Acidobacteriota bacterium]
MRYLLFQALDLDYRLSQRYQVNWDDIPSDIYQAHKVIVAERSRKERDDLEKAKSKTANN